MFVKQWMSEDLVFSEFTDDEAEIAKVIFDSNLLLQTVDPTFKEWPLSVYEQLIAVSSRIKEYEEPEAFYLRKISTKDGTVIGYVQLTFNASCKGMLWIPMLVILPEYQGKGFGKQVVNSVIEKACAYTKIDCVGLNVYAENLSAFKFWFNQGFTNITSFKTKHEQGREYNCLVLHREL